jgi:hypothetical protein
VGPSPMCEAYCGGYAKGAAMKLDFLSSTSLTTGLLYYLLTQLT